MGGLGAGDRKQGDVREIIRTMLAYYLHGALMKPPHRLLSVQHVFMHVVMFCTCAQGTASCGKEVMLFCQV